MDFPSNSDRKHGDDREPVQTPSVPPEIDGPNLTSEPIMEELIFFTSPSRRPMPPPAPANAPLFFPNDPDHPSKPLTIRLARRRRHRNEIPRTRRQSAK